jgi:hypothetical protein
VLENIWEKFVLKKPAFYLEQDPKFEFSVWYALKNLSHSIVWPILAFVAARLSEDPFAEAMWMALFWGLASHWCIDLFTHVDPEFERTDQTMLAPLTTWPFYLLLPGVWKTGHLPKLPHTIRRHYPSFGWEYRHPQATTGDNRYVNRGTKEPEVVFQNLCLIFTAFLVLTYIIKVAILW